MDAEFWHQRWRAGQIGFHRTATDENLQRHWADLGTPHAARVFVPFCGKSVDMLWLREQGATVAGVELSDVALQTFCMEHGIPARRRALGEFDLFEAPGYLLFAGDYFDLSAGLLGNLDAVFDRAALIACDAGQRAPYARRLAELTAAGTVMLLISMEYDQSSMAGPPFSVPARDIETLYARHFSIVELSREDILHQEPKMRSRGVGALVEVCYRLTRL